MLVYERDYHTGFWGPSGILPQGLPSAYAAAATVLAAGVALKRHAAGFGLFCLASGTGQTWLAALA